MSDSGLMSQREALLRAVETISNSPLLRTSESLRHLLRYLAEQTIDHPETPPKEYQIATEVFRRAPGFDSRLDSTVRVQAGRLRSKLAEYYAGPGSEDDLVISIPKGSYSLSVHRRNSAPAPPAVPDPQPVAIQARTIDAGRLGPARPQAGKRRTYFVIGAVVLAAAAYPLWRLVAGRDAAGTSGAMRIFWQPFLAKKQPPLVVFSNAEFVGAPTTGVGMRYFNSATDSRRDIRDHYTGIGEVFAVHELDRLFTRFGAGIRLKRARLLAWDDAKGGDLIFIGSTAENLPLRELPEPPEFVFKLWDKPARNDIVNLRPRPGEQASYPGSPDLPTTTDYALIALLPAPEAGHWILILAGTNTLGTQAATEFVCRPDTLEDLVKRLQLSGGDTPVTFEAVIRAQMSGGVPVQSRIVALHTRPRRR